MKNNFPALSQIRKYIRDTSAATAIAFAMAIPIVVGSAGFAVDLSMAHMVKQRLSHAIDAAALAAASIGGTDAEVTAKVNQFFYQNYPENKIGATYDLTVHIEGDDLTVSAKADYETNFAKFLGVDEMTVDAHTTVTREILGLEVVLVLDVTGSMSANNNIGALRTYAQKFLDTLCREDRTYDQYGKITSAKCPSLVKIGIVPFATTVNVGPYGLGKNPSGTTYDTAFVNNPNGKTFNQGSSTQWWGCILEQAPPNDTKNYGAGWKWNMYKYSNTYPNNGCNKAYILPLTNSYGSVKSKISSLTASGNTLSNLGMVWGYRVISPEAPFREGVAWTDKTVKKVVLFMTDGDNNIGGSYSGYGPWATYSLTDHDLDEKLKTTCENMKTDGITIYTITFTSGINESTRSYFRNCASEPEKYYNAPSQSDLEDAFDAIARELSNIHISS